MQFYQRLARRLASLTVMVVSCSGCEDEDAGVNRNAAPAWANGQEWRVERMAVIGAVGDQEFGRIVDVALDAGGRVWVADGLKNEIRVFSPEGRAVRTVGRKGGGPGEFLMLAGMDWDPAGRLWTVDGASARYSVWDTAGTLVAEHRRNIDTSISPWPLGFDHQGRLYDVLGASEAGIGGVVRHDSLLQPLDTFTFPVFVESAVERVSQTGDQRSVSRMVLPFAPTQLWVLDPNGSVWLAITDRYRIERHPMGGGIERVISRPVKSMAPNRLQRESALRQLREMKKHGATVDPSKLPSTVPVLADFFAASDGHLWVRTTSGGPSSYDVFHPSGTFLGQVRTPERLLPSPAPVVRGDHMAGVVTDEDGVELVVVMRIIRPGR
ncbi:6-bladed beta-propeller [Longimicrobium terrae]|uniref:6-bladed beta-propeller n=1 Tax=Longimicrobium terrae TaxID=1639882 RepID=A0A841GVS2_9BACT|nr:6-bladed beta-propeller [Longimicrobium terrae]MBB4635129.1 hypothetical protein [Longimicrobium terrae]MBB6069523.1 hypothetical protein [Longimicrobium terrae]NNC31675.1 hypothetical protein [Longimicrobium terrae]